MLRHRRSLTHLLYWVFLAACMQIFAWQPLVAEGGGALREALSLTIQSPPPGLLALNGQFTLDMSVTNAADVALSSVQMHLPYHPDILYTGASGMLAEPASSATLNLNDLAAGETRSLAVTVTARGLPAQQQISLPLQVTAPGVDPVVTPTSFNLHPFVQEQNQVTAAGSLLQLNNGRFQANFPSGWHNQNAEVSFQLLEQHRQTADERGVFLAFALEATANGSPITQFDTPVTLSVQIDDLVDLNAISAEDVRVYTRETEADAWQEIPATLETATGVLTITTPHFSFYQLETEEPTPWELAYTPPQASAFTGAATYGYTFALPPGVGGLAPQLSLSYSSRGVDSLRRPVMSSGFGVGWGMPQAEIINGNASSMFGGNTSSADKNHFTLALDGATYRLSPVGTHDGWHGRYMASGDPSLSIEFINGDNDSSLLNVTGEYWLVRTAANVTYRFGYIEDAEQVVTPISWAHNSFQPRNRNFAAASWKVDTITDAYGRQIRYTYGTRCGREFADDTCRRGPTTNDVPESYAENALHRFGSPPNLQNNQPPNNYTFRTEVDVALSEILYNFVDDVPQTRVLFDYYPESNWNAVRDQTYMLVGHFVPKRIVTKHGDQIISAYAFTFGGGEHYVANRDLFTSFWWVTSITAYGSDYDPSAASGTALPIQTFTYEQESDACQYDAQGGRTNCVKLLTGVANGYGAVSDITYERYGDDGTPAPSGRWFHVSNVYTWDGVSHVHLQDQATTRIRYDRGGFTACYDVNGSGCRTPYGEASNALVGFNGVQTEALTWDGTAWVALTRQRQEFSVTNYWLNGKRLKSQDIDPQNGDLLTEYTETWEWDDGAKFARLGATSSKSFHPGDSSKNLGTQQTFAYDLALQGGQQWGRATMVNTAAIVNDAVQDIYRRVITAYQTRSDSEHRLIVPYQQSLHDADWNLQQATLYLYDGSADPDNQTLAIGELRWQLNVLVPAEGLGSGTSNLSATAVSYDYYGSSDGLKRGLLKDTTTYTGEAIAPLTPGQGWGTVTTPAPANWRNRTTLAYTNDGLTPISQQVLAQDGPSQLTSFAYVENIPWLLETLTAPNLVTTRYEYDPFGRLFAVYDGVGDGDPRNSSPMLRYRYWDNTWNSSYGLHIPFGIGVETRPDDNTVPPQTHYTYYDGLGRAIQERELSVNVDGEGQQDIVVITEYDALGRAICATAPFTVTPGTGMVTDACSAHERTTTTYDALGRVQSVTAPDGNSQTGYYYAILNDLNSPTAYHRVVSVVDANQHATSQYYDAFNQLAAVREYTGVQPPYAPYATTTYTYDLLDNLRAVRDARNNQTEIEYDSLGRKTWMNDPDMGEWTYRYDAAGNLTWQQDEAGQVLCFWYDGLNRMTAKRHSEDDAICETGDTLLAAYSYHLDGVGEKGQLQEIRWPDTDNRETFDYDALGRLTMHTRIIDGQEYLMQYGDFDALHRPQELIYPDTEVVQITYDREGENSLSTTFSGALVNDVRYNARGQMTTFDRHGALDTTYSYYPAAGSNGNNNFRLEVIQHGAINDNLPSFTYTYDRVGNVKSIGERIQNNTAMQTFSYDHLDRLLTAVGAGTGAYNHSYTYNELGNILSFTDHSANHTDQYLYSDLDHVHAVTNVGDSQDFTYDANGNMTIRNDETGSYIQEFDVENRLISVTSGDDVTTFAYDAAGIRVKTGQPDGTVIHTPFPNYEVEQRQPEWLFVDPPVVNLTTPDDDSRFLATGDAPGWGLSLSQQAQWAASLLPVAVDDLATTADDTFPATSLYTGDGVGAPRTGSGPVAVNNLFNGYAHSQDINLLSGREYRLRVWAKGTFSGAAHIRAIPYGLREQAIAVWSSTNTAWSTNQTWQEINVTFIMPSTMPPHLASRLELVAEQMNGWVAFDNLRLYEMNNGKAAYGSEATGETLIYSSGFEIAREWTHQLDGAFPGTSIWRGGSGPAAPQSGSYSLVLSNLGHDTALTSPTVNLAGSGLLHFGLEIQRDLKNTLSSNVDGVALVVNYYNDTTLVTSRQLWHSDQLSNSSAWQSILVADAPPENINGFTLALIGSFYDGWLAIDNIIVEHPGPDGSWVAFWDFETPTWSVQNNGSFPAGTAWYGQLSLMDDDPVHGHVYALTNRARATAVTSTWFDAVPFQSYRIEGWMRGQFTGNVGSGSVWLEYYNGDQFIRRTSVWQKPSNNSSIWQPVSENISVPIYADRFRLVVVTERLSGWLAIDDVTVLDQTQPAPWQVTDTWEQTTNTLLWATGIAGANAPHSGDGTALTLHNLAAGALTSPPIPLVGGQTYTVEAWVNPHLLAGAVHLEVIPFGNDAQTMKIWEMNAPVNGAWQLVVTSFTLPSGPAQPSYLRWRVMELDGWVAVDDVVIREVSVDSDDGDIVFTDDFETESGWVAAEDRNFPATSIWRGDAGPAAPHSGNASVALSNLGAVSLVSPRIAVEKYDVALQFWLHSQWQTEGSAGGFAVSARYYGGERGGEYLGEFPLWSSGDSTNGWALVETSHTPPATATEIELWFSSAFSNGWAALDDIVVRDTKSGEILAAWDFEKIEILPLQAEEWAVFAHADFPAGNAFWQEDVGRGGTNPGEDTSAGFLFTNEAGGVSQTGLFPATPGQTYHLHAFLNADAVFATPARLRLRFYNGATPNGPDTPVWTSGAGEEPAPGSWQAVNRTFTIPPNTTHFQLILESPRLGGRLRLDGVTLANLSSAIPAQAGQTYELAALVAGDAPAAGQESAALVVAYYNSGGAQIGADIVWGGVDYSQVPAALQSGVFTTPPQTAHLRIGLAASVDNDVADGWLLYDRVTLTALSQPVPVAPGQSLDLSAAVRGELDGPAGQVSGRLAAHFYDSQGNLLAVNPIWQTAAYNRPTTPLTHSGSVSHPTATQVRVGLMTVLDEGWLAFESIKLSSLSAPIAARPGQMHTLAAQVNGQVNSANAGRLFIKYSNGTIVNVWQNTSTFNGSQSVSGSFTTPATVASFQVGTEVTLDKGYLEFSEVTLTAYSAALPITAGDTYQFTGQVAGALAAPMGQGGRIVAAYANAAGQSAGEDLLWQNPTNFNGTVPVQQTFTANANAATLRLALTAVLDAGHLDCGDFALQRLAAGDVIRRSTYMLAGTAVAVRVTGDPDGNDGLHYLYSDHLGSASAMQKSDGSAPIITRYLPFGGYRAGSAPNAVMDRGFTGQSENMDLGLYYYQARFYVPGIGRFASADSIVPDPANPQQYNRYSYALNNPVKYRDQSGHCVDGITTWACIAAGVAAVTKVVDWGWTAYDAWQSGRTLANPNASRGERMMAALNIGVSALFEVIEPDDILPVGLPIDDIARRGVLRGAYEALEAGGDEALEAFVRDKFGDYADDVLGKMWGALCSFSGDTMVVTEDGLVPISEVDLLDKVLAYNEETGEIGYYPVVAVWEHLDPIIVTLTIDGEEIETTPEHPFYTADGDWLPAAHLQIGDEIRTAEWETGTVEAIHFAVAPQPMYNFTVATAHTYFVGNGQWLVHNDCISFDFRQVQSKFDSHAADFGITGNWSNANGRRFQDALNAHVYGANTTKITGTYRGIIDVIHHYDPTTGLNVITDLDGNFISGWKLSNDQIMNLLNHGNLQ